MPKNFNTDNITYVGPKVNKYKAKSVYINYNKNPLILKTPTMRCPFGVGANNWEGSDYTKYNDYGGSTQSYGSVQIVSLIDMNGTSDYLEIYVRQNTSNDGLYNASQSQGGEFSGFLVG